MRCSSAGQYLSKHSEVTEHLTKPNHTAEASPLSHDSLSLELLSENGRITMLQVHAEQTLYQGNGGCLVPLCSKQGGALPNTG